MEVILLLFFKQLFCKHNNIEFVRNIYGDEINLVNARSEWKCKYCGKILYQKGLNKNYYINPDHQG